MPAFSAFSFPLPLYFTPPPHPVLGSAKDCNVFPISTKYYVRIDSQESFQTLERKSQFYITFSSPRYPIVNCGIHCVTRGCPKSALEGSVTLSEEQGRFTQWDIFARQEWVGYAWCVMPQWTETQMASPNPAHPTRKLHMQLHGPSCLLLQTASHLLWLLHRYFWEVTTSFCHLSGFFAGLTDLTVILLPPAPLKKLSILSQMVRKEATSSTMEDSGLVEVLWLHWSGEDAAACGVTTHKTWGPGMPSKA